MLGIKEFLKRFVIVCGVRPRLYLKFLFSGNNVDSLCPGRDVMKYCYGLYGRIDDHSSCVFNLISNLYQVDLKQHNVCSEPKNSHFAFLFRYIIFVLCGIGEY